MNYFNENNNIKESEKNKTVAVATYYGGAEVIVKALNFYFGDSYTRNDAVERMIGDWQATDSIRRGRKY